MVDRAMGSTLTLLHPNVLKKHIGTFVNNEKWVNWEGEIMIIEKGKKGTNTFIGRNDYYKPIVVKAKEGLRIGDRVKVKIETVTWFDFRGIIV